LLAATLYHRNLV